MARRRLPKKYRRGKNDCFRQCVARVTGRHPRKVPHFLGLYGGRWLYHFIVWAERIGYAVVVTKRESTFSRSILQWINIGVCRDGVGHAVVMRAASPSAPATVVYDDGFRLRRVQQSIIMIPLSRKSGRAAHQT